MMAKVDGAKVNGAKVDEAKVYEAKVNFVNVNPTHKHMALGEYLPWPKNCYSWYVITDLVILKRYQLYTGLGSERMCDCRSEFMDKRGKLKWFL